MKLSFFIGLGIILLSNTTIAQQTYAKPEEIKLIKERPLIVELLELDTDQINSWNKKVEKFKGKKPEKATEYSDKISYYTAFVKNYNIYIKNVMENDWSFNNDIIFKTTSEVMELRKNSKEYSIFWYSETSSKKRDDYGFKYFPNLNIPTLNYSRIEKGTNKIDYSFFMPYAENRRMNEIKKSDLQLSILLVKNHLLEIEKTGNKKYTFKKYAKDQAEKNCKDLSKFIVNICELEIHKKSTFSEIKSNYTAGEIAKISDEEISKSINNKDDKTIGFFIPWSIAVGKAGPITSARIMYIKAFINVKTGTIYSCRGTKMGEFYDPYFRNNEFKKIGICN